MVQQLESPRSQRRDALLAMAGLALVLFLVSLDQTIVGTAMPKVIADLNGFTLYAWVSTAYLLAETVVLPIVGKLGDMYGRKWITVIGVIIFVGSSAFCGMAHTMGWLIIGRGLQGLGGGMILATVFTLVADIFPDLRDRARYQGFLFSVFALSSVIGPVIGGWITDVIGWRWVFYVNIPLGLLTLFVLPRVLPQSARQRGASIDYWGTLTMTAAIVGLLLAIELGNNGHGWTSPEVLGCFALAVIGLVAFIPIERRAADPLLPFSLFRDRTFLTVTILLFLFGIAMFGLILYTPLFLQGVLGLSASTSGFVMIPMSIAMPVVGIVVGQLVARFGTMRPFLIGGTAVMSLGIFLLTTLQTTTNPWLIAGYLFIAALGMGTVMPITTLLVQSSIAPRMLGVATSATQFIRSIGSTVGTAMIGTYITNGYLAELHARAPQGTPVAAIDSLNSPNALVSQEALQKLSELMQQTPNGTALLEELLNATRLGLANALHNGFVVTLVITALALVSSFFVTNLRLAERSAVGEGSGVVAH